VAPARHGLTYRPGGEITATSMNAPRLPRRAVPSGELAAWAHRPPRPHGGPPNSRGRSRDPRATHVAAENIVGRDPPPEAPGRSPRPGATRRFLDPPRPAATTNISRFPRRRAPGVAVGCARPSITRQGHDEIRRRYGGKSPRPYPLLDGLRGLRVAAQVSIQGVPGIASRSRDPRLGGLQQDEAPRRRVGAGAGAVTGRRPPRGGPRPGRPARP